MTGKSLALLNERYRAICNMYRQTPDLKWMLTAFSGDMYVGVDVLEELQAYQEYWSDQKKARWPKSHKRSLRNWFKYASNRVPKPEPAPKPQTPEPAPVYPRQAEASATWRAWLRRIEPEIDPHTFSVWFKSTTTGVGLLELGTVVVRVPNAHFKAWLDLNAPDPPFSVRYEYDPQGN